MIEVVILGSGAALPQVGRANACYYIRTDLPLLFDFGPGALINMLRAGIDRSQLGHLFWTHHHADHISEFVPFFFHEVCASKISPRKDMIVYGPAGTRKLVRSVIRTFPGFGKAAFEAKVKEMGSRGVRLGKTVVRSRPVRHSSSLQALGYRVEYNGRSVVYSGDVSFGPEIISLCRDADLAIIEATCPAEHPVEGHMTAPQACQAAKAAGVKRLVLTHFDPVWKDYDLQGQCAGHFDGEILVAEDLMRVSV